MSYNYMKDYESNSQNFILKLSDDSTTEDTNELTESSKKEENDDVIVISDSSCESSSEHKSESKFTPSSKSKHKKVKYKRLYISETSSEDEIEKIDLPWRLPVRSDIKSSDRKCINNVQSRKVIYTSDETPTSSDVSYDRNTKKQTNKSNIDICKNQEIYKYVKETNKVATPSSVTHSDNFSISNRLDQFTIRTPQQNLVRNIKLTKKDTNKIFKNIKSTKIMYDSPRENKETKIIINESTDIDDDMMHPALSPSNGRKVNNCNNSFDVIETSINDDIIPDSQTDSSKLHNQLYNSKFADIPKNENFQGSLSERKKKQITQWLMTNQPDTQNDSSCSNIPATTRNSIDSGNSSLERLELNYETPNNRGKINNGHICMEQTVTNHEPEIQPFSLHQTNLDSLVQKLENNNSESCTPERPTVLSKAHTDNKISSSSMNKPENVDIKGCVDILDKLYGKSWRSKANILLPTTEPRKKPAKTIVQATQTERKPVLKDKYRIKDLDELGSAKNNIKSNSKKKVQQKYKKRDSFINDELSSDNGESIYHSALDNTNFKRYTKPKSVSTVPRRIFSLCDSDTEDEINDKSSSDSKKSLRGRRLSFSDNDSSKTSEFDPGDYVPPKPISKTKTTNVPQPPKVTKSAGVTSRSLEHKSFLASLSNSVPMSYVHPNARKYRSDYKNQKEELCKELYRIYNEKVFDNKLPSDMTIEWNIRMRGTAGYCYNKKSVRSITGVVKSSRIVLATKILDTPDRLRDTLIHEMCHAAAWLINGVSDGHGPFWTQWANKAMRMFPELPPIRRCHDYEIKTKFTYRCTGCGYSIGRHSKSLDIEKKRCGHCFGKFELLINKTTKSGTVQVQTPKREPSGFALYVKQNYNSVKKEKNVKHADVMKILGQQFSTIKIAKENNPTVENDSGAPD